jgi:hypothetical protein
MLGCAGDTGALGDAGDLGVGDVFFWSPMFASQIKTNTIPMIHAQVLPALWPLRSPDGPPTATPRGDGPVVA